MTVLTQDSRFEEVCQTMGEEEPKYMCEVLDIIENRGIEKGRVVEYVDLRREYGHREADILRGMMEKFSLTKEQAESFMACLNI